ncbi:MAG: MoaD family protein [Chloroflexi bacterium]|nr:MoaD family protein [Chloroflexota bacterium]
MTVKMIIPTLLRKVTGGASEINLSGDTITECFTNLEAMFPGVRDRLIDEGGEIRRFVNIYVNGEDVRFLQGMTTPLKTGDEVSIVPAVAGG